MPRASRPRWAPRMAREAVEIGLIDAACLEFGPEVVVKSRRHNMQSEEKRRCDRG